MQKKEKVLLTGAAGFIGANLLRKLLSKETFEVHVFLRQNSNLWRIKDVLNNPRLKIHYVDITDKEKVSSVVNTIKPDFILHLATYGAYPDRQKDYDLIVKTNLIGTMNLMNATLDLDYKCFINTGSSSEYGFKGKDESMSESDLAEPVNVYGVSNLAASLYGRVLSKEHQKNITTLRPFSVYGYYEEPTRLIPSVIRHVFEKKPMDLTEGKQGRDFIFIEDFIDAYFRVMEKADSLRGEIINIGTGKQTTIRKISELIVSSAESPIELRFGKKETRKLESFHWIADTNKMEKLLDWKPKNSVEDGIKKTISWFERHKDLYIK